MITLSNEHITAKISEHGAELHSLIHNGFEYIWQADSKYWGRYAPILFPIVGKAYNTPMTQHGFARDKDFQLQRATDIEATFILQSYDDTLRVYPYRFELIVNYHLSDNRLIVSHIVRNTDNKDIYFQIGGHPAFNYPNWPFSRGYLQLTKDGKLVNEIEVKHPNSSGYITRYTQHIELSNGTLPIKNDTFDNGTLIIENNQCDTIRMVNGNGQTHLTLTSNNATLFGIWSPERKNAPFVCIEPWLGRADEEGYNGEFKDKPYMNRLSPKAEMTFEYSIAIQ